MDAALCSGLHLLSSAPSCFACVMIQVLHVGADCGRGHRAVLSFLHAGLRVHCLPGAPCVAVLLQVLEAGLDWRTGQPLISSMVQVRLHLWACACVRAACVCA